MFVNFTHFACQVALFVDAGALAADEFSVACRKKLNLGPFSPQFFPSFPGMPLEIPRVAIQTELGYGVTLTGERVDLTYERPYGITSKLLETYMDNIRALIEIVEASGSSILRIGMVQKYLKVIESPAAELSSNFGNIGGDNVVDFTLKSVLLADFEGRTCNDVYNFSAAKIRGTENGVEIFRDYNVATGQLSLSSDEARRFVEIAFNLIQLESFEKFMQSTAG